MPRITRRTIALISALTLIIAAPAAANASDHEEDETKSGVEDSKWEPRLSFWFDHEQGILVIGTVDPEADEPLDCTPEGDPLTVEDDGTVVGEIPEGCMTLVIDGGENGVSHGDVVSQTIAALKEIRSELDGPFGHYVRELARSDLGKPEKDDTEEGIDEEEAEEAEAEEAEAVEADEPGPPEHAVARGHHKNNDSDENATDGDDESSGNKDKPHGPPEHANAHGRDK